MYTQTITWYTPEEMPEEWKDGRELLCKIDNDLYCWYEILRYCTKDKVTSESENISSYFSGNDDCDERSIEEIQCLIDLNEFKVINKNDDVNNIEEDDVGMTMKEFKQRRLR